EMRRDLLRIDGLTFECVIGTLGHERVSEQAIVLDLEMRLDLAGAGRTGRIGATVDYDVVARQVEALVSFRRYRLIEAAAEETAALLLGLHPALQEVRVQLAKPGALSRARAAGVALVRH